MVLFIIEIRASGIMRVFFFPANYALFFGEFCAHNLATTFYVATGAVDKADCSSTGFFPI